MKQEWESMRQKATAGIDYQSLPESESTLGEGGPINSEDHTKIATLGRCFFWFLIWFGLLMSKFSVTPPQENYKPFDRIVPPWHDDIPTPASKELSSTYYCITPNSYPRAPPSLIPHIETTRRHLWCWLLCVWDKTNPHRNHSLVWEWFHYVRIFMIMLLCYSSLDRLLTLISKLPVYRIAGMIPHMSKATLYIASVWRLLMWCLPTHSSFVRKRRVEGNIWDFPWILPLVKEIS